MAGNRVWGITPGCKLFWRSWDGEHIVYNSGSGDTHLLDSLAAEALRRLERAPATPAELESWAAADVEADSVPEIPGYIARLLGQLHALGLIEPLAK